MGKSNQNNETQAREPQLKQTVLVVDDDEAVRRQLFWTLSSDYRVLEAASRAEAVKLFQQQEVDVVISDLHLPPHLDDISEGLAIIEAARNSHPPVQVVVITGTESKRAGPEAVARGAYGFFEKPLDAAGVVHIVKQAGRMRRLEVENARLKDELVGARGFGRLIGSSQALGKTQSRGRSTRKLGCCSGTCDWPLLL
jgi:two-component system NtrC family response regulator